MAITEQSRHQMIEALSRSLGQEAAMTLASHLPSVGWADVTTKHDLEVLHQQVDARFEKMEARFDAVDARFDGLQADFSTIDARFDTVDAHIDTRIAQAETRIMGRILTTVIGSNLTMGAMVLGVLSLTG
jgi:hypothetical protein